MRKLVFVLALFTCIVSCNKKEESDITYSHSHTICTDGFIHWGGDPAADGSGWNLRTGDGSSATYYILKDLPDNFKTDGLSVSACVEETEERAPCFCGKFYSKIISIKKR